MIGTRKTRASLALLGALLLAGGCSGGDDDSDGVASVADDDGEAASEGDAQEEAERALFDWVDCMREEGVDLPDPTRDEDGNLVVSGNGITIGGGDEGGFSNDEQEAEDDQPEDAVDPQTMDAASEVCGNPPAPPGEELSEEDLQAQQDAALEFADCMREQGIDDFPDPDFSDQGPGGESQSAGPGSEGGGGGGGPVIGGPFGQIDMGDPEMAAAFEACQDHLGGPEGTPPLPDPPAGT